MADAQPALNQAQMNEVLAAVREASKDNKDVKGKLSPMTSDQLAAAMVAFYSAESSDSLDKLLKENEAEAKRIGKNARKIYRKGLPWPERLFKGLEEKSWYSWASLGFKAAATGFLGYLGYDRFASR